MRANELLHKGRDQHGRPLHLITPFGDKTMSYVHERDGLAACPDDFARTGSPDDGMTAAEETEFDKWKDTYTYCVRENVKEVLRGDKIGTTVLCGDNLHFYAAKEIFEMIRDELAPEDFDVLIAATLSPVAADKAQKRISGLIEGIAERSGQRLAESKAANQGYRS